MTITCHSRAEFTGVIAGLVREGLTFRAEAFSDGTYFITLTGGF
jgi:hypothetical protein